MEASGFKGAASCLPILMKPLRRFGFGVSSPLTAGPVIRLRPRGYWSRFQALVETIRQGLSNKLARGRRDPGLPRSRQRHWLKGLLRQVKPIPGVKLIGQPA
ncbi:hypothetical protein DFAR_3380007 [Desulfarculales bacterium]